MNKKKVCLSLGNAMQEHVSRPPETLSEQRISWMEQIRQHWTSHTNEIIGVHNTKKLIPCAKDQTKKIL